MAGLHHLGGGLAGRAAVTKTGVVGGIMLGLGRALGETMAVTFVIGNINQLDSLSLFEAANSITSALANEFAEAGERAAPGVADLRSAWSCSSSPSWCWRCGAADAAATGAKGKMNREH